MDGGSGGSETPGGSPDATHEVREGVEIGGVDEMIHGFRVWRWSVLCDDLCRV